MVNPKELMKICKLKCNINEICIDDINFDYENAFDKYFNIEYLIDAIDSNAENELSNADLAQWAYLFMNIISHNDYAKLIKNDAIKYVVINLITDYLDGLSFYDEDNFHYLQYIVKQIGTLDYIYKTKEHWKMYADFCCDVNGNKMTIILLVNDNQKMYFLASDIDLFCDVSEISNDMHMEFDEIEKYVQKMNNELYFPLYLDSAFNYY